MVFDEGVRLASILCKAPEQGKSIFDFKPNCDAAKDYQLFIDKFLETEGEQK